jgi:RNA polymerase II-associated factor 1
MLPDLDAFPDSGTYVTLKFTHNPVNTTSTYDRRLLSGIFVPLTRTPSEEAVFEAAMAAHELDPARNPRPSNAMNYNYFLADTSETADAFRSKFDLANPDRDNDALYTTQGDDGGSFHFDRLRGYEASEEKELGHDTKYSEEIVLSFVDAADGVAGGGGAVFYYPVMQRSTMRSQRDKNIARTTGAATEEEDEAAAIDQLDITIVDPSEEMVEHIAKIREDPLHWAEHEEEEEPVQSTENVNGGGAKDAESPAANGRYDSEEQDAEGDEE